MLSAPSVRAKALKLSPSPTADNPVVSMPAAPVVTPEVHVLIADGDEMSRQLREAQLRSAGCRVSVARTAFEAIVKASCHMPDVILLDASLSDIGASETGRLITTCPATAHIPVVHLVPGRPLPRRVITIVRQAAL